jgi:1,2-diacylglycerol 3-alpha-glucosyltransferase
MKIAYFSDNFYPEISGISDSIITTGQELRKLGHEVVYIAARYSAKEYKPILKYDKTGEVLRDSREDLFVKRLPSLPMPNSPTGQSRVALPILSSYEFLKDWKPDVIHTQSPYGCGIEAWLVSKLLKVPLVGTNHTPIEEFVHYAPLGRYYEGLARKYDAWYYNRCVFVTAPYQGLLDNMRTVGFKSPGKGQANPVPFASSPSTKEQKLAAKIELQLPGPTLLCSGRLAPEKKVDVILEAVAKLTAEFPTITLLITGHGSVEGSLKKLAAKLGIEKNVQFLGFVDSSLLPKIYRATDAYVLMSTAETQSLSLMQAFAAGVPAVTAKSRGLVDYTPESCGFLIEPGNAEELAAKVALLLNNSGLREQMGEAGAKFVTTLMPLAIAHEWEQLYRNAIEAYC